MIATLTENAQVPDELRQAWAKKQDVIISHDATRIDLHGGSGQFWWRPRHLTQGELRRVTDAFVVSLLHHKVTSINVALCKSLTDESIKAIAKDCPGLEELNVSLCNNIRDKSIKAIAKGCPELKGLNVSLCENLTDESIKAIAKGLPELKELRVAGIQNLTDESIKAIAKDCPKLKELNVWGIENLTDESIKAVAKGCPELKELNVIGINNLTDESIKAIARGCPELKDLTVIGIENVTDESIKAIANGCPELMEINVWGIQNLTDESITAIAHGCPKLRELNVVGIRNLTDESIKAIAKGCPELKKMKVECCNKLTDESIKAIAQGCPELEGLNVCECENLTDESIKAIAEGCPELKELDVSRCEQISDSSIKAIAEGCPELKELDVSRCEQISDSSIKAVARGCPELKELDVSRCNRISDSSVEAIAKGCPELEGLDVSLCIRISDSSMKAIAKGCPELKTLSVSHCGLSEVGMKAISDGLPGLEDLRAEGCGLQSLPANFCERLTHLKTLRLGNNALTRLPPSIVKHLRYLNVANNPLESPPCEIANRGLYAIKRYFEQLEKGSSVSKLLKVVFVGDGKAGKTSLRNALAGRPNPRQEDRTIHLDIEKITLTSDLDINVYDCGGQEEYLATQLPYLTGLALYIMVVEAEYATDDYAHVVEDKLHRFLVVLQNRVPGAVVLPIVTKADTVEDSKRRCHWLESKIVKWLQDTRQAVCCDLVDSTSSRPPLPELLVSDAHAHDRRTAGYDHKHNFIPLRVQSPALAVSVADTGNVGDVRDSVRAVRERIIELTKHKPPLLRGVGQQIPSTYLTVLNCFGAIAEYGDNDLALEALRDEKAHALGETSKLSPHGIYRPKDEIERIWQAYSGEQDGRVQSQIFDDATQLWEAQGLIFVDAGLVVLQPEFLTTIVKPLVDHRYSDEKEYEQIEDVVVRFLKSTSARGIDTYSRLVKALTIFRASGEVDCSEESLFLAFLWRNTELDRSHHGQVLQMLATSGVILKVKRDAGEKCTVVVVPFRLPHNPDVTKLERFWPESLPSKERELKLRFESRPAFPTGLGEYFVTDVHGLGTSLCSWRSGVVVKNCAGYSAFAKLGKTVLHFAVRFEAHSSEKADAAWNALCNARNMLAAQRENRFPGLFYKECFVCEVCCRNRKRKVATEIFNAKSRSCVFRACGHCFYLDSKGKCDDSSVTNIFNAPVSKAQLVGIVQRDVNTISKGQKPRRANRHKKHNASNDQARRSKPNSCGLDSESANL